MPHRYHTRQSLMVVALAGSLAGCTNPHGQTYGEEVRPAYVLPVALAFSRPPVTGLAGETMLPVKVTLLGARGEPAVTSSDWVTVGMSNGSPLFGTTTVRAVEGVAVFDDLRIDRVCLMTPATKTTPARGCTMSAMSAGLPTAKSPLFEIRPGPPVQVHFATTTLVAAVGRPVAESYVGNAYVAVRVAAADLGGNPVPYHGDITVRIGANPAGGTLSGDTTETPLNSGQAYFSGLYIDRPGAGYTLTAHAPGLASRTSTPFSVAP